MPLWGIKLSQPFTCRPLDWKYCNALAAAYRGLDTGEQSTPSAYLPQANVERNSWAWHVQHLMLDPKATGKQELHNDETKVMYSQVI